MADFTLNKNSRSLENTFRGPFAPLDQLTRFLTGAPSRGWAQQDLLDLAPHGRFNGYYFLLMNALIPVFEPRVLAHRFFVLYSLFTIVCFLCARVYMYNWSRRVAEAPERAAVYFALIKVCQNLSLSSQVAWSFLTFGYTSVTDLDALVLMAFAVGTVLSLRPSLAISRISMVCCLLPAIVVSAWLGGKSGFGTAIVLSADGLFLWMYALSENGKYWTMQQLNRELQLARLKARREGARIGDALLTTAARHSAIVAERNRIAFEWHDTLLAGFSAISLQLDEAKRRQRECPERAFEAIDLAANMLQHYRAEARLAISDLLLEDQETPDLVTLMREKLAKIGSTHQIGFDVSTAGNVVPLVPDLVRQISRIVDEAFSNAVRHGRPTQIQVLIAYDRDSVSLEVSDDGLGFDPAAPFPGHFGLHIMRQRARRLCGDFKVESSPGCGTTVTLSFPYSTNFNMTPTRILVIEDQYFSRLALHTVVDRNPDMQIIAEADSAQSGLALFQAHTPDVVIVDLKLPDQSGIELIKGIRRIDPSARILVFSNFEGSEYLHRATEAGAMAYLTKDASAEELCTAIRAVRLGQSYIPSSLLHLLENRVAGNDLTLREHSVLRLLVLGWSNKQIADHLGIAEKTVRIHLSSVFSKLGVANRTQAVLTALQNGFVDTALDRGKSEVAAAQPLGDSQLTTGQ